jgi:MFS family permease
MGMTGTPRGMAIVFFVAGAMLASFAARAPALQARFELTDGALGLAFACLEAGAIVGLPLGGALCARAGSRTALRLGFVVYPCGLAGIAWSPFVTLAVCAIGTSIVDVAMNIQGVELERR